MYSVQAEHLKPARDLLDQLFVRTAAYRSSVGFLELIDFITNFRSQSPFNAYLLRCQFPYVTLVATAAEWELGYGAKLKENARPLVILKPFGPVGFVYDISEVEPDSLPHVLQRETVMPGFVPTRRVNTLLQSAQRHGIGFQSMEAPRGFYGKVTRPPEGREVKRVRRYTDSPKLFHASQFETSEESLKATFVVYINNALGPNQIYVTVLHEIAHVLCGHLGPLRLDSSSKLARDRSKITKAVKELEAEAASYIAAARTGVDARSHEYLARYVEDASDDIEDLSLDAILTTAGDLEKWGERTVRPYKASSSEAASVARRRAMNLFFEDTDLLPLERRET